MPERIDVCGCGSGATGGVSARAGTGSKLPVAPSQRTIRLPGHVILSRLHGRRLTRFGQALCELSLVVGAIAWAGCHAAPGVETAAFASGKPKSQVALQRTSQGGAARHGWYRSWHEHGRLQEEGLYVQGRKQGVWTIWDASGRKRGHEVYDDGRPAGRWLGWHANGRLVREERYELGALVKHGE